MKNKINLGIIGKNFGYKVIYKSFLKNKKYKVKGFSFKSKKLNNIKIPKNIKIYDDWKRLILDKKIDAIVVAAPPLLHDKIIKFAIKNNKHIFCEKPFTCSLKKANITCDLLKKNNNISHMVNYEFPLIEAFQFFKKNIATKILIKEINLNWFIKLNRKTINNWKENHTRGGGIIFNYICHLIYYLEFLFGNINSTKNIISSEKENDVRILKGKFYFINDLVANLNIQVGDLNNKIKPIHQIKINSNKGIYALESQLNNLSDKFKLVMLEKKSNKVKRTLFEEKNNKDDFRIRPTFKNSKKFSDWILKGKMQNPNFYDAKRIHEIINKVIFSSKTKKRIYIN